MVVRRSKIIKRLLLCRNVLLHMVAISLVARLKRVIKGYEIIGIFITFYNPFGMFHVKRFWGLKVLRVLKVLRGLNEMDNASVYRHIRET